jgi:RNA polymerase sigma factor (sigma-70 family)
MTRAEDDEGEGAQWDIADDALLPEDALSDLQQRNVLRNALDRLEQRCRELLLMLFRDEGDKLSYEEVARRLGIAVGSIGATRARCLAKLRELVEPGAAGR